MDSLNDPASLAVGGCEFQGWERDCLYLNGLGLSCAFGPLQILFEFFTLKVKIYLPSLPLFEHLDNSNKGKRMRDPITSIQVLIICSTSNIR